MPQKSGAGCSGWARPRWSRQPLSPDTPVCGEGPGTIATEPPIHAYPTGGETGVCPGLEGYGRAECAHRLLSIPISNSTLGQRKRPSPRPCPVMLARRQRPPAAIPAACAGAAAATAPGRGRGRGETGSEGAPRLSGAPAQLTATSGPGVLLCIATGPWPLHFPSEAFWPGLAAIQLPPLPSSP